MKTGRFSSGDFTGCNILAGIKVKTVRFSSGSFSGWNYLARTKETRLLSLFYVKLKHVRQAHLFIINYSLLIVFLMGVLRDGPLPGEPVRLWTEILHPQQEQDKRKKDTFF